ncbi:MAG TPA: class I SAM-dependent methyltransferase [Candidatus Atribacteria bacterium]|nr:class I SAM-dependent methyltransferase [Candidatus Atribacteria bacterium]
MMIIQMNMEYIRCDLCGSDDTTLLFVGKDRMTYKEGEFNVVKCNNCGLVYLNPRPTQTEISRFYSEEYSPFKSDKNKLIKYVERKIAERDVKKIKKLINKNNINILEIGCATGEYLSYLRDIGDGNVTGVEISPYAAEYARREHRLNVITGTIFDGKFTDESFDVIIMKHVFEHVHNPSETLKEINRLLDKNGKFIFFVPNIHTIETKIFGKYWHGWDVPRHLYDFNPETIKKLLNKTGFVIHDISYSLVPNDWIWGCKHFLNEKSIPLFIRNFFNVHNVFLLGLFFPFSFCLSILHQSGRIKVIAEKRGVINI